MDGPLENQMKFGASQNTACHCVALMGHPYYTTHWECYYVCSQYIVVLSIMTAQTTSAYLPAHHIWSIALSICTWYLKNQVWKIKFEKSSLRNQVWKIKFEKSSLKNQVWKIKFEKSSLKNQLQQTEFSTTKNQFQKWFSNLIFQTWFFKLDFSKIK